MQVTALVLELAPAGELFDFIMHTGRLHEDVARTYFAQVTVTLYCMTSSIYH
jgi:hypothetical protein